MNLFGAGVRHRTGEFLGGTSWGHTGRASVYGSGLVSTVFGMSAVEEEGGICISFLYLAEVLEEFLIRRIFARGAVLFVWDCMPRGESGRESCRDTKGRCTVANRNRGHKRTV